MDPNTIQLTLNEINQLIIQISYLDLALTIFACFGVLIWTIIFFCLVGLLLHIQWRGLSNKKAVVIISAFVICLTAGSYLLFSFNPEEKPRLVCLDRHYKKSEIFGSLQMTDRPRSLPYFKYVPEEKMIANIHQLIDKSKKQLTESIKANVIANPNADRQKIIIEEACQLKSSLEAKQFNNKIQNNVDSFINQLFDDGVESAQKLESLK